MNNTSDRRYTISAILAAATATFGAVLAHNEIHAAFEWFTNLY